MSARDPLSCALLLSSYLFNYIFMTKKHLNPRSRGRYTLYLLTALSLASCRVHNRQAHQHDQYHEHSTHTAQSLHSHVDSLVGQYRYDTEEYEEVAWLIYSDTLRPDSLARLLPSPSMLHEPPLGVRHGGWIKRHIKRHSDALKHETQHQLESLNRFSSDSISHERLTSSNNNSPQATKRGGWRTWPIMVLGLGLMVLGWRLGRWVRFRYLCPR